MIKKAFQMINHISGYSKASVFWNHTRTHVICRHNAIIHPSSAHDETDKLSIGERSGRHPAVISVSPHVSGEPFK